MALQKLDPRFESGCRLQIVFSLWVEYLAFGFNHFLARTRKPSLRLQIAESPWLVTPAPAKYLNSKAFTLSSPELTEV